MNTTDRQVRLLGAGGIAGPAAFLACWIAGGVIARGDLSPSADAISRLAAAGADTRWMMATGFISFGVGVGAVALAVRAVIDGPPWLAIAGTAAATALVASAPLDVSPTVGRLHAAFALAGYVTLIAAPILAARPLRDRGFTRLAAVGRGAAGVAAVALALSVVGPATGLLQRIGLTAVDVWLIALATLIATGRLTRVHEARAQRVAPSHADARSAATDPTDARTAADADTGADSRARSAATDPATWSGTAGATPAAHPAA